MYRQIHTHLCIRHRVQTSMCLMSGQRTHMHNILCIMHIMHWIIFLGINCQCGVDLIHHDECVIGWTNHTGTMVKTPQRVSIASKYYKYMYQHVCWFTQGNLWWYLRLLDCEDSWRPFFLKTQEMLNLDSTTIIKSDFV